MLTSNQRASLRKCANKMETILQIGKGGILDTSIKQINDALTARELIKIRVLDTAEFSSREAANEIASKINCEVIQVIGSRIVLFRYNEKASKYDEFL